jgi:outer membrane immunogenic protein
MSRLLISVAAAALMSSVAVAADIPVLEAPVEAVPVAVGFDWSGFYTGGFVGYGWADVNVTDEDGYTTGIEGEEFSYETDGLYAGSLIGYNFHWNWAVLGIEAEIGHIDFEDEAQNPDAVQASGNGIASVDTDLFGNISGRLGFVWDRFLVYGKGGLAFADVEVEYEDSSLDGSALTLVGETENDEFLFGYTVGGGVEVGVGEKWTVRGEYMYADLEEISHTASAQDDAGADVRDVEFTHDLEDIHTVKLGVTRRF